MRASHYRRAEPSRCSRAEDADAAQVCDKLVVRAIGAVANDGPAGDHPQELVQRHTLPSPGAAVSDGVVLQLPSCELRQLNSWRPKP